MLLTEVMVFVLSYIGESVFGLELLPNNRFKSIYRFYSGPDTGSNIMERVIAGRASNDRVTKLEFVP